MWSEQQILQFLELAIKVVWMSAFVALGMVVTALIVVMGYKAVQEMLD